VGHFVLYGIMAFLMNISFPNWKYRLGSITLPGGGLLFAVFSILEEISQSFFASRSSSLLDVACSLLGVVVFSALSTFLFKRSQKPELNSR